MNTPQVVESVAIAAAAFGYTYILRVAINNSDVQDDLFEPPVSTLTRDPKGRFLLLMN